MVFVYVHTVPNGKMYVGKAKDLKLRWNGGEGYVDNRPFYKDIKSYGWDKIKHEIVAECIDNESASVMESVLIAILKTENEAYGYNQTRIYENAMKKFTTRVSVEDPSVFQPEKPSSFFEQYNLPRSACENLIDEWIFSESSRSIAKDRLLNDLSYDELSQKYGKSVRGLKYIIQSCCDKLEKHL